MSTPEEVRRDELTKFSFPGRDVQFRCLEEDRKCIDVEFQNHASDKIRDNEKLRNQHASPGSTERHRGTLRDMSP